MIFFTLSAAWFKRLSRLWPPLWFIGIRFEQVSDDFKHIRTTMPLRFYNGNLQGLHFGGSLYSMTDPCFLAMILRNPG